MSIRDWGRDGEWTTNYSGIAVSNDNGQNWGVYPGTIRAAGPDSGQAPFVPGNENFQMGAFLKAQRRLPLLVRDAVGTRGFGVPARESRRTLCRT